jgi:hypothetical protein
MTLCAIFTESARASNLATIAPSLSPDRPGMGAALNLEIRYSTNSSGVPTPVRRAVLRLPAGLSLDIPKLRICSPARLRRDGARGCPSRSQIGSGHALAEVHAGSQTITEEIRLWAFLGPLRDGAPALEILGQGYSPFERRVVLTGTLLPARAPYGEELAISVPAIPTLPLEPDASMLTFSLTIGEHRRAQKPAESTVTVPALCPIGGFPFAAEFSYADGSHGGALATVPC